MIEYTIAATKKGFIIREIPEKGMPVNELYAFSTLKELTEYLPTLLEPQIPMNLNQPTVGKSE